MSLEIKTGRQTATSVFVDIQTESGVVHLVISEPDGEDIRIYTHREVTVIHGEVE